MNRDQLWRRATSSLVISAVSLLMVLGPSTSRAEETVGIEQPAFAQRSSALPLLSLPAALQQTPGSPPRDSIKNGAWIGAVAGAVAFSGFGLFLCHALDDTGGHPNCFPGMFGFAAIGGGIGLGAGIAVDALLTRDAAPVVRVRVTF